MSRIIDSICELSTRSFFTHAARTVLAAKMSLIFNLFLLIELADSENFTNSPGSFSCEQFSDWCTDEIHSNLTEVSVKNYLAAFLYVSRIQSSCMVKHKQPFKSIVDLL